MAETTSDTAFEPLGPLQLRRGVEGARRRPGRRLGGDPLPVERPDPVEAVEGSEPLADDRVAGDAGPLGQGSHLRPGPAVLRSPGAAARRPLEGEGGEGDVPTVADVAEAERVGHAHVGEEHLVERRAAAHLPDGPDLDAGGVDREQEGGEPGVLGHRRVGPADQLAPRREAGARAPHLLAVDHPLVCRLARAERSRGRRGRSRRRARRRAGSTAPRCGGTAG